MPRASRPFIPWLLAAPAIVLLLAFFLWPMLLLLRVSFFESPEAGFGFYRPGTWSTHAYIELLGERFGRGIITFTIALGVSVAVLSLLIGYPLALFIHSLPRRAKVLALGVVILPKLANVFIVLYGINLLLGNIGPVNRFLLWLGLTHEPLLLVHNLIGVVIAETYLILPYAVLVLVPAFDRIDPTLTADLLVGWGPGQCSGVPSGDIATLASRCGSGRSALPDLGAGGFCRSCSARWTGTDNAVGLGTASGDRIQRLAAGCCNRGADGVYSCRVRGDLCLARRLAPTNRRSESWVKSLPVLSFGLAEFSQWRHCWQC